MPGSTARTHRCGMEDESRGWAELQQSCPVRFCALCRSDGDPSWLSPCPQCDRNHYGAVGNVNAIAALAAIHSLQQLLVPKLTREFGVPKSRKETGLSSATRNYFGMCCCKMGSYFPLESRSKSPCSRLLPYIQGIFPASPLQLTQEHKRYPNAEL